MKNKEKIQILVNRLNTHAELLDKILTKLELDNDPQLKQLDQSVFDGMDIDCTYAAVDGSTGRAYAYEQKPHVPVGKTYWHVLSGMQQPIDYVYDTSNWQNSLIERESIPQLKQLEQSVFNGLNSKWLYAAIDKNGSTWVYTHKPDKDSNYWYVDEPKGRKIGEGYDTTNWQTSLIKRETIELTGSDLARAMLARGDKYVMCVVGTVKNVVVISGVEGEKFTSTGSHINYHTPTPINNQGKPLTSSDVGL